MFTNSTNTISKMFSPVAPGLCRLSMNGIAIKTNDGYKVYDVNTGTLINCADFVFDIGDDMFFCIPTNSVNKGDIILSNGKPVCVISINNNQIQAFRYHDSSIVTIVPENLVFMGSNYFYSKIVSFCGDFSNGFDMQKIAPLLYMQAMMKNDDNGNSKSSKFSEIMMMSMMINSGFNFNSMFGNLFNPMATNNTNSVMNSVAPTNIATTMNQEEN